MPTSLVRPKTRADLETPPDRTKPEEVVDNNRELSGFTFPPPHTTTTTQSLPTHSDTLTTMTSPSSQSVVTPSSTATIDVDTLHDNFQSMSGAASAPAGPSNDQFKDMYGMLVHLCKKSNETEEMKTDISSNKHRLCRLEARLGNPDDIVVPLSLAIRNLPLPGHGSDDLQIIRALFLEINAKDVNIDNDIVRVVRQGATHENLGTVMVEMRSDESRASIMKTKRVLENHHNPGLRKVIIKNMKDRLELKMDIALNDMLRKFPGGENYFVANNGHIREKNAQQKAYQNSFSSRVPPNPVSASTNLLPPYHSASAPYPNPGPTSSQFSRPPPPLPVTQALPFPPPVPRSTSDMLRSLFNTPLPTITPVSYPILVPRPSAPFVFIGLSQPMTTLPPSGTPMPDPTITPDQSAVPLPPPVPSSQPDTVAVTPVVASETDPSQAAQPAVVQPAVSLHGPSHEAAA